MDIIYNKYVDQCYIYDTFFQITLYYLGSQWLCYIVDYSSIPTTSFVFVLSWQQNDIMSLVANIILLTSCCWLLWYEAFLIFARSCERHLHRFFILFLFYFEIENGNKIGQHLCHYTSLYVILIDEKFRFSAGFLRW